MWVVGEAGFPGTANTPKRPADPSAHTQSRNESARTEPGLDPIVTEDKEGSEEEISMEQDEELDEDEE